MSTSICVIALLFLAVIMTAAVSAAGIQQPPAATRPAPKVLWSKAALGYVQRPCHAVSSVVYCGEGYWLTARKVDTGDLIWKYEALGGQQFNNQPLVAKDMVCGSNWDNNLYCVSRAHGSLLFKLNTNALMNGRPVVSAKGDSMYVTNYNNEVIEVSFNGTVMRKTTISAAGTTVVGVTVDRTSGAGTIFVPSGQSGGGLTALTPDFKVLWQKSTSSIGGNGGITIRVAFDDGIIYAPVSPVGTAAFSAKTGEILWHTNIGSGGGKPVLDGDVVYAASGRDIVAIEKKTGKLLWKNDSACTGDFVYCFETPRVLGSLLIVGGNSGTVAALDKATGYTVWTLVHEYAQYGGSQLVDGKLIFGTWDENPQVVALEMQLPGIVEKHCEGTQCQGACLMRTVAEGCENIEGGGSRKRECTMIAGTTYMTLQMFRDSGCDGNAFTPPTAYRLDQCFVDSPFGSGEVLKCPINK